MFKTLGIEDNFLGIEDEFSTFKNSKAVILPVPYERTVSYGGGTKDGPNAILNASGFTSCGGSSSNSTRQHDVEHAS